MFRNRSNRSKRFIAFSSFALLSFLFSLTTFCSAAIYYVDASNGDDNQNGLSPETAWKTIAKVNGSRFNPGDHILFERGEVWRETLVVPSSGAEGRPITFGAYGSGAKPIISAADDILMVS